MRFENRLDAGRRLARVLRRYASDHPVIVALPRGGVPVAFEIALALDAPLEVLVARKLGAPKHPELGIGAIAEGGTLVVDEIARALHIDDATVAAIATRESEELARRVARYRGSRPLPSLRGKTVILVDDGIATGVTTRAAIRAVRAREPSWIVLAVPIAAAGTAAELRREADDVVCLHTPHDLVAVGRWYRDFRQVSDEEVVAWLGRARREHGVEPNGAMPSAEPREEGA